MLGVELLGYSCGILHGCTPASLTTIVIVSLLRKNFISLQIGVFAFRNRTGVTALLKIPEDGTADRRESGRPAAAHNGPSRRRLAQASSPNRIVNLTSGKDSNQKRRPILPPVCTTDSVFRLLL